MNITDIIVNNIEYDVLEISSIKHNMKNPSIRTDRNNNSFKSLKNNIKTNGLISPIVVDRNYNLIDGHRRLNALKDLGHKLIPSNINRTVDPKNYGKIFYKRCKTNSSSYRNVSKWSYKYIFKSVELYKCS